ncbi:MAG: hypothetical protein G01um10145_727 [Microgenomates group bacterium Gr01-1014_5]|nr:MAG: hypothetical protein G01um10145_727 [Microgenomates group bacterium Gr01-1014_5]
MRFKNIAVFGFSDAKPEDKLYQEVTTVAALVAKEGYTIVNGGGPGVMRASTEGAKASGGKTVGITFNPTDMTFFEGRDKENKVDELIECSDYVTRTLRLLEYGDCYIIFNGGTGTLSELGMSWALARLYHGHSKPFVLYGGFWYPIMEEITRLMKIRKEELELYRIAVEPADVVKFIHEFEEALVDNQHKHPNKAPFRI